MGAENEPKKSVTIVTESTNDDSKPNNDKKKKPTLEEDTENAMSEEDQELKERLETCVSTLLNAASEAEVTIPLRSKALDVIVTELRSATSSMTSVPKPLKFLRPHFVVLKELHATLSEGGDSGGGGEVGDDLLGLRARLADVLAVLSMTMGKPEERESLKFKLSGMKDYDLLTQHNHKSTTLHPSNDNI